MLPVFISQAFDFIVVVFLFVFFNQTLKVVLTSQTNPTITYITYNVIFTLIS